MITTLKYPIKSTTPSFPPISPTGALASGDYVDYMIGYDGKLADYIQYQFGLCYGKDVINDWLGLWDRMIYDIGNKVTELTDRANKLQAQVLMIVNIVNGL